MTAIPDAVSTCAVGPPSPGSLGLPVAGQTASTGFAVALAAAKGASAPPGFLSEAKVSSRLVESAGSTPCSTFAGAAQNVRTQIGAVPPIKKLPTSSQAAPSPVAGSIAALAPPLTATQAPSLLVQAGSIQLSVTAMTLLPVNLIQPNLAKDFPATVSVQASDIPSGNLQPGPQTMAANPLLQSSPVQFGTSSSAGTMGRLIGAESVGESTANPPVGLSTEAVTPSVANVQTSLGSAEGPAQAASFPENVPNGSAADASGALGGGIGLTLPALRTGKLGVSEVYVPLTADATLDATFGAREPTGSVSSEIAQVGPASIDALVSVVQNTFPASLGGENPTAAIVNFTNSNIQNSNAQDANVQPGTSGILNVEAPLPSAATVPVIAPGVLGANAASEIRGPNRAPNTAGAMPSSNLSTGADGVLPPAGQTPFSIFFAGPGPGTESAASVLPKMILPAGSAVRESHSAGFGLNFNSQTGTAQSGNTHNSVAPMAKAATGATAGGTSGGTSSATSSGTANATTTAEASQHAGAELSAATVQAATVPIAASAVPASNMAMLPLAGSTLVDADSLPRPGGFSGNAPGNTSNVAQASPEMPAAAPPGPVQMAQMVMRVEQSEMRIGMNTSAFGSVEVRAVVHASDVGLVVGSEKGDLRALMANDIPAISNMLQEQNLRLHSVNFMQGFAFSNNASGGGDSQQRAFVPQRAAIHVDLSEAGGDDTRESSQSAGYVGARSGLSILA